MTPTSLTIPETSVVTPSVSALIYASSSDMIAPPVTYQYRPATSTSGSNPKKPQRTQRRREGRAAPLASSGLAAVRWAGAFGGGLRPSGASRAGAAGWTDIPVTPRLAFSLWFVRRRTFHSETPGEPARGRGAARLRPPYADRFLSV